MALNHRYRPPGTRSIMVTRDDAHVLVWYPGTSTFHVHDARGLDVGVGPEVNVFTSYGDSPKGVEAGPPTPTHALQIMLRAVADADHPAWSY